MGRITYACQGSVLRVRGVESGCWNQEAHWVGENALCPQLLEIVAAQSSAEEGLLGSGLFLGLEA